MMALRGTNISGVRCAIAFVASLAFSPALAENPMRPDRVPGGAELGFSQNIVAIARRDLGKTGPQLGLPARLWCADFVNFLRRQAGLRVVPSRKAIDQARYGHRVSRPVVGALLIQGRRGGAHVSIITAVHGNGTVTAISGNDGRRVRERVRSAHGIIVQPR